MPKKIFFDIETLPPAEAERPFFRGQYEEFLKKRVSVENAPTFEQYFRNLALEAATGRLLTIGVIVEENNAVSKYGCLGRDSVTGDFHLDEARTLRSFWKLLNNFNYAGDLLIGHNALDFDLLFLLRRSEIKMFSRPCTFQNLINTKPGFVFDTMWRWTNDKSRIGMPLLARALNLPNPKGEEIDGSKIYDAFIAGRHQEIRDYCLRDVECVRSIYYRMNFKTPSPLSQTAFPLNLHKIRIQ